MSALPAVICDLDGSLFDTSPVVHLVRQAPKDREAFYRYSSTEAAPIPDTLERIQQHATAGRSVLYVTGRSDAWHGPTQTRLREVGAPAGELMMRRAGDYRVDVVVKREIYETSIAPRFVVVEAIDDKPSVIAMWSSLGIPVYRVPGWED